MTKRKGATRRSDIPAEVLAQLNAGTLESATLAEGLAVDFEQLLRNVDPHFASSTKPLIDPLIGITKRMALAGQLLHQQVGLAGYDQLRCHPSDTVRGWSAFLLAEHQALSLKQRLTKIKHLADDPHFGVREWAWLATRPSIAAEVELAIELLGAWTKSKSASVRRFAVEITRPRGVWCQHLDPLKAKPELGISILEPLRADESIYVQDSVANWLNDASKSQPDWVRDLSARWLVESPVPTTARICRRALRSIK